MELKPCNIYKSDERKPGKKIIIAVGARPNFMKIVYLYPMLQKDYDVKIVHTGQHYDANMSDCFLKEFNLDIAYNLECKNNFGMILDKFMALCKFEMPDLVIVVGDVMSTLACALGAKYCNIKVAHIEAGLRSGDMKMHEEVNRIATDSISNFLFATELSAYENLYGAHLVGNTMLELAKKAPKGDRPFKEEYALCTIHRRENLQSKERMTTIADIINELTIKVIFPCHPNTKKVLKKYGLRIDTVEPYKYSKFINTLYHAKFVLTDSGGIQCEADCFDIPCYTMRENTERKDSLSGSNRLVGFEKKDILDAISLLYEGCAPRSCPHYAEDELASERIYKIIKENI